MTVSIIQSAKANMGAEAYESGKLIAVIRNEQNPQFVTYIETEEQKSAKHSYYVFLINQSLQLGDGRETNIQTKRTTHYHKAIGIAVSMSV